MTARRPGLMAFLLDLPEEMRNELAARWSHAESPTTAELFRAMTEPGSLRARLDALPPGAAELLGRLAEAGPASAGEMLARVPLGGAAFETALRGLGELGLVLRAPLAEESRPRPAASPFGAEPLYVPPEVAAALGVPKPARPRPTRRAAPSSAKSSPIRPSTLNSQPSTRHG